MHRRHVAIAAEPVTAASAAERSARQRRRDGVDAANLDEYGFERHRAVLAPRQVTALLAGIAPLASATRSGCVRGIETRVPAVRALATDGAAFELAAAHLGARTRLVRALLFSKSPAGNWAVGWHQDRTLAVGPHRPDASLEAPPGWGPWSIKDGVAHVQPPRAALEAMLCVRVHLDDATADSGCLRLVPGSHRAGVLSPAALRAAVAAAEPIAATARAGDALLMRPLAIHASERCTGGRSRRVLHLEYAAEDALTALMQASA